MENDDGNSITIIWHIDDVFDLAEREGRARPTDDEAREVLAMADKYHDANYGICWDTLSCYMDTVCGAQHDSSADEDITEGGAQ